MDNSEKNSKNKSQVVLANMQIYQFANKATPAPQDLLLISDEQNPGHVTKNSSYQQLANVVGALIPIEGNVRYVAMNGDDVNGTGSLLAPWATAQGALNHITDNTSTKPYTIQFLDGYYASMAAPAFKPFIQFNFGNAHIIFTGAMTIDSSWATLPAPFIRKRKKVDYPIDNPIETNRLFFEDLENVLNTGFAYSGFSGGILTIPSSSLDFSAISGLQAIFNIRNFQVLPSVSTGNISILGNPSGNFVTLFYENNSSLSSNIGVKIQDSYSFIKNNVGVDLNLVSTGTIQQSFAYLLSNAAMNSIAVAAPVGGTALAHILSSPVNSSIILNNGQMIIDSESYTRPPTGSTPTNYTLISLADGVNQANYSPINYVKTAGSNFSAQSNTGDLKGIDLALGNLNQGGSFAPTISNFSGVMSAPTLNSATFIVSNLVVGGIVDIVLSVDVQTDTSGNLIQFEITPPITANFSTVNNPKAFGSILENDVASPITSPGHIGDGLIYPGLADLTSQNIVVIAEGAKQSTTYRMTVFIRYTLEAP